MADLSVAGRIWDAGEAKPGILHIDSATGRIAKVARSGKLRDHVDLGDRLLLPGAIDIHVHFREPGHTHKEDVATGSAAAAHGGVTGFVDMPNTVPPTTTNRALTAKLDAMQQRSRVRWAAWAGGTWFTEDLPEMLRRAAGIKVYLGATTGDLLLDDPKAFQRILQIAAKASRPVVLHCEAQRVLEMSKRAETTVQDHDVARPPLAEVEAIYDVMKAMAGLREAPPVHVCHTASKEALRAAKSARFSTGVCPHHLLLDTSGEWVHAYGKVNPPLRSAAQREALWALFADGSLDILESDHAPHTRTEKEGAFAMAPAGLPGVETMVPIMLAQVQKGHLGLRRLVDATSTAPAKLLGIEDHGRLTKGHRADFYAVDLEDVRPILADDLHSKCGWTPYEDMDAVFPSHVFVAGRRVVTEGHLEAEAPMPPLIEPA